VAVVITYQHPMSDPTLHVPPTAVQAEDQVTALIEAADGDVAAAVVHNMTIPAEDLSRGFPWVVLEPLFALNGTEAALASWIVAAKDANSVTLAKTNAGGSGTKAGPTVRVHILHPHTIGR
jgi:hypothetical protein